MDATFPVLALSLDYNGYKAAISVDYHDCEHITEAQEDTRNVYDNVWFSIPYESKSRIRHFNNCIFEKVVTISNAKYISFNHCFFKQGIVIEDAVNAESVAFRGCVVEKGLILSESTIDKMSIMNSNFDAFYANECVFKKTMLFSNTYFKLVSKFDHCDFDGYDVLIDDCESEDRIEFYNCTSRSRLYLSKIETSQVKFEKCNFKSLNVENSLIRGDTDSEDCGVYLKGNSFTGALSFDNIVCTSLCILRTNMFGGCFITKHDDETEQKQDIDKDKPPIGRIVISGDRINNELHIGKIYDHIKIEETEFNCKVTINCIYTNLLTKGIIARINKNSRAIEIEPKALFNISNAMRTHNQSMGSSYYYIAYKAMRRERAPTLLERASYTVHDLLSRYGTSYYRIIVWSLLIIAIFTIAYSQFDEVDYYTALYHSGSTFFTIGFSDLDINNDLCKMMSVVEGAIGLLLMTYLVIVMTNKRR